MQSVLVKVRDGWRPIVADDGELNVQFFSSGYLFVVGWWDGERPAVT